MLGPTYDAAKITGIMVLFGFIMGMDIPSLSMFLGKDHFNLYFNNPGPIMQGLATGASPMGGLFGCLLYNSVSRQLGRVTLFRASSLLWVQGSIVGLLSYRLWMVVFSRWIKGIAIGLCSIVVAAYITEVIPKHRKGRTMALVQFSFSLAMLSVYYMCIGVDFLGSPLAFRVAWGLEMVPALATLVFTMWLPETPEWLILTGNYVKAEATQNGLAKHFNDRSTTHKMTLYNKLEMACLYEVKSEGIGYKDLLSNGYWRQVLMGSTLQLLVQFSGISILMYYTIFICDMVGLRGTVRAVTASMPYIINVPLGLLPVFIMDHVKRKDLTLAGAFPLGLIMMALGVIMATNGRDVAPINGNETIVWSLNERAGPFVLGLSFLFVAVFAVTLSITPWVYTNEILPAKAKHKGLAACMLVGWAANFLLTLLGPLMLSSIKWGTFILLGSTTLIIALCILFLFPDTKELSTRLVEDHYEKKSLDENIESSPKPSREPVNRAEPIGMLNNDDSQSVDIPTLPKLIISR